MDSKLRRKIISHLETKGNYDPDVDDYLIDDLLKNMDLCRQCERILDEKGPIEEYEYKEGKYLNRINPAVNAYQMFQRNIHQISAKLGISRNDRIKLKLIESKQQDEFDQDFN